MKGSSYLSKSLQQQLAVFLESVIEASKFRSEVQRVFYDELSNDITKINYTP